jgi:hypothetical protein
VNTTLTRSTSIPPQPYPHAATIGIRAHGCGRPLILRVLGVEDRSARILFTPEGARPLAVWMMFDELTEEALRLCTSLI